MLPGLVYAIHGFLGQATDWDQVKNSLPNLNFIAESLFSKKQAIGIQAVNKFSGNKIFIGYSMGGRLGLQILKTTPELFNHFIFISTNPGLPVAKLEERKSRILNDKIWSDKISAENWINFLKEWNAQSVFQGLNEEPKREVSLYDLQKLKEYLSMYSLGKQEDFSEIIRINNKKISWVVGERDLKYCAIAETMKKNKILSGYERISSGHRIWLDNPNGIVQLIIKF